MVQKLRISFLVIKLHRRTDMLDLKGYIGHCVRIIDIKNSSQMPSLVNNNANDVLLKQTHKLGDAIQAFEPDVSSQ